MPVTSCRSAVLDVTNRCLFLVACALIVTTFTGGCPTTALTAPDGLTPGAYSGTISATFTLIASGLFAEGDPDRLEANSTLREACDGWLTTDGEIRGLLLAIEQDRLNGFSRSEETNSVLYGPGCDSIYPDLEFMCVTCGLAGVDQVYSIETAPAETTTQSDDVLQTLVVQADGTPDESYEPVQVGFMIMRATDVQVTIQPGVCFVEYSFELDLVDTTDGFVLATLIGVGIDTYTQQSDGSIETVSQASAGYFEALGAINISIQSQGLLTH